MGYHVSRRIVRKALGLPPWQGPAGPAAALVVRERRGVVVRIRLGDAVSDFVVGVFCDLAKSIGHGDEPSQGVETVGRGLACGIGAPNSLPRRIVRGGREGAIG